jgi:GNAT superfamily N-acetyltransferase
MNNIATGIEIVTATDQDAKYVAGLIATAFEPLEAARWQIGDDDLRRALFPGMFMEYVEHAFAEGSVEITTDLSAAALWLVETGEDRPAPPPPAGRLATALGPWAENVHAFDLALHAVEPTGTPFEKLSVLAVRPGRQGHGLGSALLAYHLAGLDRRLVPAYLEASNKASRELYLRFGFNDLGGPITLSDDVSLYPMWREPGGVAR